MTGVNLVYVEHTTPTGGCGVIGLEVNYHEALTDAPARHRPRYDEVTREMRCFRDEHLAVLRKKPLEQIWRDHMLAGSMLIAPSPVADGPLCLSLWRRVPQRGAAASAATSCVIPSATYPMLCSPCFSVAGFAQR